MLFIFSSIDKKSLLQPLLPHGRHESHVLLIGADNLVVNDSLGAITAVPVEERPAGLDEDLHVVTGSVVVDAGPVQRGDLKFLTFSISLDNSDSYSTLSMNL